jgi:nucleotide-binding universal stress UspA family protein
MLESRAKRRRLTMKRILIATDGSTAAHEAVELGVELARDEAAEAVFVHVVPRSDMVSMNGFGLMATVPYEPTESDEQVLEDAQAVAEREGVPAGAALLRGDPIAEITRHADTIDADLVVVGSRGTAGSRRRSQGASRAGSSAGRSGRCSSFVRQPCRSRPSHDDAG